MNRMHDSRPASRYEAVTPTTFRQALDAREPAVAAQPVVASGARLLRRVRTQLVYLALRA
jgi:hypothetical protein